MRFAQDAVCFSIESEAAVEASGSACQKKGGSHAQKSGTPKRAAQIHTKIVSTGGRATFLALRTNQR